MSDDKLEVKPFLKSLKAQLKCVELFSSTWLIIFQILTKLYWKLAIKLYDSYKCRSYPIRAEE